MLTERDHCYCVLLNAHDGAAFPSDKELQDGSSSSNFCQKNDTSSGKEKNSKVCACSTQHMKLACLSSLIYHELPIAELF